MIAAIVAKSNNNIIGKDGNIPWKIKGEQKRFKELTTGNIVIMGRKSYDEIGHPLPNRDMIIVTSQDIKYEGVTISHSIEEALSIAKSMGGDTERWIFIAGGGQIYKETVDICDRIYLTNVDIDIEDNGNCVYFPELNMDDYYEYHNFTSGIDIKYEYLTLLRKDIYNENGTHIGC